MSQPEDPQALKAVYHRFFKYVKPYWRAFIVATIGMVMAAVTDTGFAMMIKPMLDGSFVDRDPEVIAMIPLAAIGIFLFRGIGTFIENYYMTLVGRNIVRDMRGEMFSQLLQLPASYYDSLASGKLTAKLIYDVEQIALASTRAVTVLIKDSITITCLIAWMLYLNWMLSVLFLGIGPFLVVIVSYVSKRFRKISKRIQSSMGDVTGVTQEAVDGNRVVKAFGGQSYEQQRFLVSNKFNHKQNMKMAITTSLSVSLIQLIAGIAFAAILYVATLESFLETVTVGTFMSFVLALSLLFAPLKRLTSVNAVFQKGIAAAQSIFNLLDAEIEQDHGIREINKLHGDIEFNNVNFTYGDTSNVVHDISFKAEYGQTLALVGRSGSGKSTLVSLIPRFYEINSGSITIDGLNIREMKLSDLRSQIALVSQHVSLFDDTIANNIAYGQLGNCSRDDVVNAATAAHAMEFITDLPEGLDTMVGTNGIKLSGGQRQRIAIARAILKDAPIFILDEATSALDSESERYIQSALEDLMVNRTTLVIAHRLSTIEKADQILVMDKGVIVEQGTHAQLLEKKGVYENLYNLQFRVEENQV